MTLNLNSTVELVEVGSRIVELGAERKIAIEEVSQATAKLKGLEAELLPLIARHAKLIQEATGMIASATAPAHHAPQQEFSAAPVATLPDWAPSGARLQSMLDAPPEVYAEPAPLPPQPQPMGLGHPSPRQPPQLSPDQQLKNRVKSYLKTRTSDESISASDVAEVLRIDSGLVREAMREMKTGR